MADPPPAATNIAALWLSNVQSSESNLVAQALGLLLASANEARKKWPRIYGEPIGVRLICPASQQASQILADAAAHLGCALSRVDAPLSLLAAQCDLAVVRNSVD